MQPEGILVNVWTIIGLILVVVGVLGLLGLIGLGLFMSVLLLIVGIILFFVGRSPRSRV